MISDELMYRLRRWDLEVGAYNLAAPSDEGGILREMYKQSNLFVGNDPVSFREGNNIR